MKDWNIKPADVIILVSVFFIMLVIVVAPDFDLLDTAFHRGTAPVVVHARATSAPAATTVPHGLAVPSASLDASPHVRRVQVAGYYAPNFLPIVLRSIRR
jgi:hypothetical protein